VFEGEITSARGSMHRSTTLPSLVNPGARYAKAPPGGARAVAAAPEQTDSVPETVAGGGSRVLGGLPPPSPALGGTNALLEGFEGLGAFNDVYEPGGAAPAAFAFVRPHGMSGQTRMSTQALMHDLFVKFSAPATPSAVPEASHTGTAAAMHIPRAREQRRVMLPAHFNAFVTIARGTPLTNVRVPCARHTRVCRACTAPHAYICMCVLRGCIVHVFVCMSPCLHVCVRLCMYEWCMSVCAYGCLMLRYVGQRERAVSPSKRAVASWRWHASASA
jgi:hypothetical protein